MASLQLRTVSRTGEDARVYILPPPLGKPAAIVYYGLFSI